MFKQLFRFAQSPITYQDDVALKKFITIDPCAIIVREVLKDPNKVVDFGSHFEECSPVFNNSKNKYKEIDLKYSFIFFHLP